MRKSIEDLNALEKKFNVSKTLAFFSNRGFHALFFYRIAHFLFKKKVPLAPLLLTRFIQIIYGIDIDYRAKIHGGVIIIHGVGLVIGMGAEIKKGCVLYHQVTLGIKGNPKKDGFPIIEEDCTLGAGAKILGPIIVKNSSIIGANVVLTKSIEANSVVKVPHPVIKNCNES